MDANARIIRRKWVCRRKMPGFRKIPSKRVGGPSKGSMILAFGSKDAVELGHPLPRAAFSLVFFPDDVAQLGPDFLRRVVQAVPDRVAFLLRGENRPPAAHVIAAVETLAILAVEFPLMTLHGATMRRSAVARQVANAGRAAKIGAFGWKFGQISRDFTILENQSA